MLLTYSSFNITSFQKKMTLHDEVVILYKSSGIQYTTFYTA